MGRVLGPDGDRIMALRMSKGWSQEQLAQMADLNARTIRRVEAGNSVSFEALRSIAGVFGLEVCELMEGSANAGGGRLRRIVSAEIFAPLLGWCQPYAPAAKGLMASFALILLGASAISLAPLLVETDGESPIVDSFQSFTSSAPPIPVVRTGPVAKVLNEMRVSMIRGSRSLQPAGAVPGNTPAIPDPVAAKPAPQNHTAPVAEHPNTPTPSQAIQTTSAIQTIAGAVHTHWLTDLAQPGLTMTGYTGQFPSSEMSRPGSAGRGSAGGSNVLGRTFVRSGKSTAWFFGKVGGSIKRAF